jgi:hypothetical protein
MMKFTAMGTTNFMTSAICIYICNIGNKFQCQDLSLLTKYEVIFYFKIVHIMCFMRSLLMQQM